MTRKRLEVALESRFFHSTVPSIALAKLLMHERLSILLHSTTYEWPTYEWTTYEWPPQSPDLNPSRDNIH